MAGHVFVVHGDITHIACDDWLIPTDSSFHVAPSWWKPGLEHALRAAGAWSILDGDRAPDARQRKACHRILPLGDAGHARPRPWLVSVEGDPVANAVAFIRRAAAEDQSRFLKRARRLIAVPVIGTGWGGHRADSGDVLAQLIPALAQAIGPGGAHADVVIVTYSEADFAAAQHARRRAGADSHLWAELPEALRQSARGLAELSMAGRLVLFLGAGMGVGAGLPMWDELLDRLATRAGLTESERRQCRELGELDRGEYIAQRLRAQSSTVGAEIAGVLQDYSLPGLGHCLVAGLPCSEAVTTNYDRLFETACDDVRRPAAVLPYAPATRATRWLLKMHGCVEHEADIVLTRQNYLRYAERNAALAGIVQAMLITRHMLFLGFSLRDDNFLRIVDQVRRAVNPEGATGSEHRLGTAIMLSDNPLLAHLWRGEIDWVCLSDEPLDNAEAGRRFEIFLDCLSQHATSQGHLLDPRFEGVLSEDDVALKNMLSPLLRPDAAARRSPAWPAVRDLVVRLGGALSK